MRICYVANSRFPSERAHMTQIVHMCNALNRVGHEVTLLVTDRQTTVKEQPDIFYGVPLNFSVERVAVPDIAGISPKIPRIFRPYAFMIQRIAYVLKARKHIVSLHYDCVYGRDEWVLWLLSFWVKAKVVWESHEARFSYAARQLLKKIPLCVVISEGIRDFYVMRGIVGEKILVAHDAIDERFFDPLVSVAEARSYLKITTSDKPVVMYIGGFEYWKGVETFLQAAEKDQSYHAYCIGGKSAEIELLRKKYPRAIFLGQKPYRDLHIYQQAADILVIPNSALDPVSSVYTSPLKLFAHMTSKKPIVASRVPSLTVVLGDDCAMFFEPDNAVSLNEAIRNIQNNRENASKMALNAYTRSIQSTWTNRAKVITEAILRTIKG